MTWTIKIHETAKKQLTKLDRTAQKRIIEYLHERIDGCKNPRHLGEPLKGGKSGLWRYRVGNYRIICEINDDELVVLIIAIGHRRLIYKQ